MGPRPDGRGKWRPTATPGRVCTCVNGAAARRPRKGGRRRDAWRAGQASMGPRPDGRGKLPFLITESRQGLLRQWGRGQTAAERPQRPPRSQSATRVNGAAARRPRKASTGSPPSWTSSGVNGAAARRPRKDDDSACLNAEAGASMGPRPDGRGKRARLLSQYAWRPGRQWGRGQTAAERTRPRNTCAFNNGVNGAAARRPRKVVNVVLSAAALFSRQWGRGQTAAESMNPQTPFRPAFGVNGAAARRPRKGDAASLVVVRASQRQWGRGQTAAESRRPNRDHPRPPASMGPRPDGRGKAASADAWSSACRKRQWGRGQTAAERVTEALKLFAACWRQWGRGQTAAERT